MKKNSTFIIVIISVAAFAVSAIAPAAVFAQSTTSSSSSGLSINFGTPPSLIVCGVGAPVAGTSNPVQYSADPNHPNANHPCGFTDLITLANAIIIWMIWISIPLALVGISYGGWLYMTDNGNESNVGKAKDIFKGLMLGFIWLLVAYAVVYTIVNPLLNTTAGFQLFKLG